METYMGLWLACLLDLCAVIFCVHCLLSRLQNPDSVRLADLSHGAVSRDFKVYSASLSSLSRLRAALCCSMPVICCPGRGFKPKAAQPQYRLDTHKRVVPWDESCRILCQLLYPGAVTTLTTFPWWELIPGCYLTRWSQRNTTQTKTSIALKLGAAGPGLERYLCIWRRPILVLRQQWCLYHTPCLNQHFAACSAQDSERSSQNLIFSIEGSSSISVYSLNTVGSYSMADIEGKSIAKQSDNANVSMRTSIVLFRNWITAAYMQHRSNLGANKLYYDLLVTDLHNIVYILD